MRTQVTLIAGLSTVLGACISDPGSYHNGGQPDAAPMMTGSPDAAPPPPNTMDVSGDITASATWSGAIRLTATTTIKAGATITVSPSATIYAGSASSLIVEGTLLVNGAMGTTVTFTPDTGATKWPGIDVASGGSATIMYADISHADMALTCETGDVACDIQYSNVHDNASAAMAAGLLTAEHTQFIGDNVLYIQGGDVTLTDSVVAGGTHDLLVQSGGSLTVSYSQVGSATTYQHCGFHISASTKLQVDHSILNTNVYGFMLGGSPTAKINHNNYVSSTTLDVEDDGGNTGADLSNNWWTGASPSVAGATVSKAGAAFTDVGPRN
jgi:hypothetical protein